jgi:hypothetical protein
MFFKTSDSIINISKALLQAQKQMGAAKKDSANPFFRSKYADLGSVMEVCKQPLNDAGIVLIQPTITQIHADGSRANFVITRLVHAESGEYFESTTEVIVAKQNDPQAKLAGETYTRRGALQALLSIPAEDDDGNTAANRGVTQTPQQASKPVAQATTQAPKPTSGGSGFRKPSTTTTATVATPTAQDAPPPVGEWQ